MMKGTPCSRGNLAPLKASSKTRIVLRSRGSAPGGVWGSGSNLLASAVNGSVAGTHPHYQSREAGSCMGAFRSLLDRWSNGTEGCEAVVPEVRVRVATGGHQAAAAG